MTEVSILNRLSGILREVFDDETIVATPRLAARDVQGWDSLGNVRLFVEIERAFGVRFNATELGSLQNVGQLVTLLEKKGATAATSPRY